MSGSVLPTQRIRPVALPCELVLIIPRQFMSLKRRRNIHILRIKETRSGSREKSRKNAKQMKPEDIYFFLLFVFNSWNCLY